MATRKLWIFIASFVDFESWQSKWLPWACADQYGTEHRELGGSQGVGWVHRGRTQAKPHSPEPGLFQRFFSDPPVCR